MQLCWQPSADKRHPSKKKRWEGLQYRTTRFALCTHLVTPNHPSPPLTPCTSTHPLPSRPTSRCVNRSSVRDSTCLWATMQALPLSLTSAGRSCSVVMSQST